VAQKDKAVKVSWESDDEHEERDCGSRETAKNPFYSDGFLSYLLTHVLPYSSLLDHSMLTYNGYLTVEDTNALVESWFTVN
jgi:hypothetical protein